MGVHARRACSNHRGAIPRGTQLRRRPGSRRPLVFPTRLPAFDPGAWPEGCEFLLVFDDGAFSENETFLITDWFAHTPRECWRRTSASPPGAFDEIPLDFDHSRYVFDAAVPPALDTDRCRRRRARLRSLSATGCSNRSRSRLRAAACGSPTPRTSRCPRGSPRRWSRSIPVGCANCIGTRTGRVAVLPPGQRSDDGIRLGRQGAHVRLPGR